MILSPLNDVALRCRVMVYDRTLKKRVPVSSGTATAFISKTAAADTAAPSHADLEFTPVVLDATKGDWLLPADATELTVERLMEGAGAFAEGDTGYFILKIEGAILRAIPFTFQAQIEESVEEEDV